MDKPLTMAAPSSDGDDDRDTPSGVMAPPAKTASRNRSGERSASSDEDSAKISSNEGSAATGTQVNGGADLAADRTAASAGESADSDSADEGVGSSGTNGPKPPFGKPVAPLPADGISTNDGRSEDGSGQNGERLPTVISARQAVKQAMAATNNWFTGRAAKVADGESAEISPATPASAPTSPASAPTGPDPMIPSAAPASGFAPRAFMASGSAPSSAQAPRAAAQATSRGAARPLQYGPPGSRGPAATARRPGAPRRTPRQAQLTVARVEPWSVMKFSAAVSVVAFVVIFVAVAVLYVVLSGLGVFDSLQHFVTTVTSSKTSGGSNIRGYFSASRILGYTAFFGIINIVLIVAMSTIGAVVYNLIARINCGIEVSLRETD